MSARHPASLHAKLRAVLQISPAKVQEFLHLTQEILQTARVAAVSARHLVSLRAKLRAVLQISLAKTDKLSVQYAKNTPIANKQSAFKILL